MKTFVPGVLHGNTGLPPLATRRQLRIDPASIFPNDRDELGI
jgi:hypothetical protein